MSTDTEEKSSTKKTALDAVGNLKQTAGTGDVLTFQVKSADKPTFETSDNCPRLFVARTPAGYWAASWVPTSAGDHTITASLDGADPVVFNVTAKEK